VILFKFIIFLVIFERIGAILMNWHGNGSKFDGLDHILHALFFFLFLMLSSALSGMP
jgi:hypothetical protein